MPPQADIAIRECSTLEDFEQCVSVQRSVWGFEDRDLIPRRFFVVARKIEGQVFGAVAPSGRLVGFCLGVPALRGSTVYLHSHMLAVLPEYRRCGLGKRLKLEQRREALARGIRLVEWTFDPFELKNAHFNLERLGAVVRRYVVNLYGLSSSPLHRGLPTDRLVAEWWLEAPRVLRRLARQEEEILEAVHRRIDVPLDIVENQERPERMAELQQQLRRQFQEAFADGLTAVGFELTGTTGTYLLSPWAGPSDRA